MNNEITPESTPPSPEAPQEAVTPTPVEASSPAVAAEAATETDAVAAEPVAADAVAAEAAPAVDVAAQLKALFPALFTGGAKPLKLRIQADIQERAPGQFSKAQLSAFFRRYTGSTSYLIALTKAKARFDLDGKEAGEVAEEHLSAAKEELERRRNLKNERINAEREQENLLAQQRRNRAGLLWDFERTTLTPKNFCTLKGVSEEELPGLLDIARKERAEAPQAPVREAREAREPRRDDRRPPRNADRRGPPPGGRRNGGGGGGKPGKPAPKA